MLPLSISPDFKDSFFQVRFRKGKNSHVFTERPAPRYNLVECKSDQQSITELSP